MNIGDSELGIFGNLVVRWREQDKSVFISILEFFYLDSTRVKAVNGCSSNSIWTWWLTFKKCTFQLPQVSLNIFFFDIGCDINRFRILEKQIFEKLMIASKCPRNHFNSFIHVTWKLILLNSESLNQEFSLSENK